MRPLKVNQLFEKVWNDHWNTPRFQASGWAQEVRRLYTRHIGPTFGEKRYGTLKAPQIRAWHKGMAATPINANRALEVLSKLLSYAEEKGWQPQGANPVKQVKAYKERKRKRFASPEEIKKVSDLLEKEARTNPVAVAFIYSLLFTGARPRSLERSTWNMLQLVTHENQTFGVLTFDGKSTEETGEQEQVVLPPQVIALLDPVRCMLIDPRYNATHQTFLNERLFGIKMPKDLWARVRKEAGCVDLWARDLRRTFAVVALSNGVSAGIIGQLLNHKSSQTTLRYLDVFQNKKLEATKTIADQISLLLKGGTK